MLCSRVGSNYHIYFPGAMQRIRDKLKQLQKNQASRIDCSLKHIQNTGTKLNSLLM